jgi:putative aminopeptidase FrvX
LSTYIDSIMDELTDTRTRLNRLLGDAIEHDALAALRAVGGIQSELADHQRAAVRAAAGRHTWGEIGEALGVSRQAAHHKFAKEWAQALKDELKTEHRTHKAALRRGDHTAAAEAKRSRDALIAEAKAAGRAHKTGR